MAILTKSWMNTTRNSFSMTRKPQINTVMKEEKEVEDQEEEEDEDEEAAAVPHKKARAPVPWIEVEKTTAVEAEKW